jgi:hypothetical protein
VESIYVIYRTADGTPIEPMSEAAPSAPVPAPEQAETGDQYAAAVAFLDSVRDVSATMLVTQMGLDLSTARSFIDKMYAEDRIEGPDPSVASHGMPDFRMVWPRLSDTE